LRCSGAAAAVYCGGVNESKRPATVRVLIVEDQRLFRSFLENWLAGLPKFSLVAAVESAEEALGAVERLEPDVMIVDLQLPGMDGLACVQAARQMRPQLRALVLSSLTDPLSLTRVRESGVEGYVEKDASPEELADALTTVAAGHTYYSAKFAEVLLREGAKAQAVGKILSRREQEVLTLVLGGKTSREISELIGLSARTIEFHRANVMAKLGAGNFAELVASAKRRGLAG
jgi:Response regulator containing a CheY-like receiver domain and an HTH DNA-binding domain